MQCRPRSLFVHVLFFLVLTAVCMPALSFWQPRFVQAEERMAGREEELELTTSIVSLASYSDELSLLAREWLQQTGWHFSSQEISTSLAQGRCHLLTKDLGNGHRALLLAFPGTENVRDAKVDLRVKSVPFGGASVTEFIKAAQENRKSTTLPLVHKGFDDYTMAAVFQAPADKALFGREGTLGEQLAAELKANPEEILILTGHSLGGAAATLTAARLSDMGVRPQQLRVITFGAPAVGDERFARRYETKMDLTRVVMDGDPVAAALQSLGTRYVQFGSRERWQQNRSSARFEHEMVVYLDDALRNYFHTIQSRGSQQNLLIENPRLQADGGIFVTMPQIQADPLLTEDAAYIRTVLRGSWQERYRPCVLSDEKEGQGLPELCRNAERAGCHYVIQQVLTTERIREETYNFRIVLETLIYDTKGNLLTAESKSTTASRMTPLEAVLYLEFLSMQDLDIVFGVQNT